MIETVSGVIIWTDRLDRLVAFYRDVLQLPVHSVRPSFVAFAFGDFRLSIGLHDGVHGEANDPYRIMVNFNVTDIAATYTALRERGVEFIRPPALEEWGGWVATLKDPDGNILQLLQQP